MLRIRIGSSSCLVAIEHVLWVECVPRWFNRMQLSIHFFSGAQLSCTGPARQVESAWDVLRDALERREKA
jgi:hypothetical protein